MKLDPVYCDNCGDIVYFANNPDVVLIPFTDYSELPFNIESATKGESGIVCAKCEKELTLTGE